MEHETLQFEHRLISVVFPLTREEYDAAMASAYQVATTEQQRRDWGLPPTPDLPEMSTEQAMKLLFAQPGDPALDEFDTELGPSDEELEAEMEAEHASRGEVKLDANLTLDEEALMRGGAGGEQPPPAAGSAPPAPGAPVPAA